MIEIIIADDHPIVREGLKRILQGCDDMALIAEAANGDKMLELCERFEPDVAVLDISMPGPEILDLIRSIRQRHETLSILVLSIHPDQYYAVRLIRAGADGYLNKQNTTAELIAAIRKVHEGQQYLVTEPAGSRLHQSSDDGADAVLRMLSDREFQVFCALASGRTVTEIAADMDVSSKTISTYRSRLLKKLKLTSTADIITYALRNDINIDPGATARD